MTVVLTADQLNTVSRIQGISAIILDQLNLAKLIIAEATDKGYGLAGANAITDVLLQTAGANGVAPYPALTAQNVFDAAATLSLIDTTLAATTRQGYTRLEKMRP